MTVGDTVHALFEQQVRRSPDAIAIVHEREILTYVQLNARANRLAHHLTALGVRPGGRVGLRLPRSVDFVVAIFAVLKAGGAYVPLEERQPGDRLRRIAAEAGLSLVIARDAAAWPNADTPLLSLTESADAIEARTARNPAVPVGPDDLCYIPYTSGSTGQPKGIEVPHRSVPGFFTGVQYAAWGSDTCTLQHMALSWDGHVLDVYPTLLRGGRLVIFPADAGDPVAVARYARDCGVNLLSMSTAAFHAVVDVDPGLLGGVRHLLVGGEAMSRAHAAAVLRTLPDTTLVNGYGPSECTVFTCTHVVTAEDIGRRAVPIGEAIGDRVVHLLDEDGREVPDGRIGELCVGGPGVGRGYLGQPALTADRFRPDESGASGARIYRSGDLVRRAPEGLQFVGRIDDQVKIRGLRVEPGEVAALLRSCPGVLDAAVVPSRDEHGVCHELHAYVVVAVGFRRTSTYEILRSHLPAAMVPAAIVTLDRLPLTSNGKLARQSLPAPTVADRGLVDDYAAPRSDTESFVAALWQELLGTDRVGRDDDFFAHGGHSLAATRVAARVGRRYGVEVSLQALYDRPHLATFAEEVDRLVAAGSGQGRPTAIPIIERIGTRRPRTAGRPPA